jgi:hypothetical protein
MYGTNLERRIYDKMLYEIDSSDIPRQLFIQSVLSPFLWIGTIIDSFHWSGNSSLFQTELMSLWISDSNISPPAWISSTGIWSLLGDLYFFYFAIAFLGRLSKKSVQIRVSLEVFVTSFFLRWGVVNPTPNPQSGGPPLVVCPRLLIQYIRS